MSRYQELIQARADLVAEGKAALSAAEGRALTAEEMAADDTRETRLTAINAELAVLERQRERERSIGADVPSSGFARTHARAADQVWGAELGVKLIDRPDGIKAFGGIKFAGETALGACMQAIFKAAQGGPVDPRLTYQAAASGGNTSNPSQGGFSVGTLLSMFLFEMGMQSSALLPLCNVIPLTDGNDGIEAPYITDTSHATGSRFGGVRVYRRKEAATVTASQPEEEKFELRLADLMGIAYQTDRAMRDARALGVMYATAFKNEFAFKIDDEIVRGTGIGEMQGIINSPALATISIVSGQTLADAAVLSRNLSDMWVAMPARLKGTSVWLYNGELGPALDELTLPVAVGALEPRFVNYGPDGILRAKGRPMIEIEQASAPGTVGDLMLVNLGEYNVITKGEVEQAESDHVRFIYNERAFRWTQSINGKSHWRSAVTPYKGSVSRSPFVVLNTRS